MKEKAEPMPSATLLHLEGLRPMNGEDALEFAALEDPELDAQRRLLKLLAQEEESSELFSRARRRQPPPRQTSTSSRRSTSTSSGNTRG